VVSVLQSSQIVIKFTQLRKEKGHSTSTHLVLLRSAKRYTQMIQCALILQIQEIAAVQVVFIFSTAAKVQVAGACSLLLRMVRRRTITAFHQAFPWIISLQLSSQAI